MTESQPQKYQLTATRWSTGFNIERKGILPEQHRNIQVKMEEDLVKAMTQDPKITECRYSFEIK